MTGEYQRTLAVVAQREKFLDAAGSGFDAPALPTFGIEIPEVVDMRELRANAAQIFPHTHQDRIDFGGRFFREGRGQIGSANLVFGQPRADGRALPMRRN